MRIVLIGGSGHIGSYLVPRLVQAGHEVINVSRSMRKPYIDSPAWKEVQNVIADRDDEDASGTFGERIKNLRPDVVIDNICFTPDSAKSLAAALSGTMQHLLVTGSQQLTEIYLNLVKYMQFCIYLTA